MESYKPHGNTSNDSCGPQIMFLLFRSYIYWSGNTMSLNLETFLLCWNDVTAWKSLHGTVWCPPQLSEKFNSGWTVAVRNGPAQPNVQSLRFRFPYIRNNIRISKWRLASPGCSVQMCIFRQSLLVCVKTPTTCSSQLQRTAIKMPVMSCYNAWVILTSRQTKSG